MEDFAFDEELVEQMVEYTDATPSETGMAEAAELRARRSAD